MKTIGARTRWKGRDAVRLTNGIVELVSLDGGGHLAEFRFLDGEGLVSQNVLWEAPWMTFDPVRDWPSDMSRLYGSPDTGKFLAGFTGHALCLDYFGDPPAQKAGAGLGIHGEAAAVRWQVVGFNRSSNAQCTWHANLPITGLTFERKIELGKGQSVAYVQETVRNPKGDEHVCDWVEHVTFGPQFMVKGDSTFFVSAESGMTSPLGYEGKSIAADDLYFHWPFIQRGPEDKPADLRLPFSSKGRGFLAGVRLDQTRQIEYLIAVNSKLRLGVGYCFRRRDFPWMALWEENCARQDPPWNGTTQARGMEFGTTPLPLAARGGLRDQRFANTSRGCRIPAHGEKTVRYIMFLFMLPAQSGPIGKVAPVGDVLRIEDESGSLSFSVAANGCEAFLA